MVCATPRISYGSFIGPPRKARSIAVAWWTLSDNPQLSPKRARIITVFSSSWIETLDAGRDALRRLLAGGVPLDGAADHGVGEALYLRDPDQNGIELYWDRPAAEWPRNADGSLAMTTRTLGLADLLSA